MNTVRIYATFRALPDELRPCHLARSSTGDRLLIACDPSCSRTEVVEWCVRNLSAEELDAVRYAYGEPPSPFPLSDVWLLDAPMPRWIPESLRVPGEPMYLGAWDSLMRDVPVIAS